MLKCVHRINILKLKYNSKLSQGLHVGLDSTSCTAQPSQRQNSTRSAGQLIAVV